MNGDLIIKNASELVTCSGYKAKRGSEMGELHVIRDGAVVVRRGVIESRGPTREVLSGLDEGDFTIIDAAGKSVLPGFVDSHTHFVFGGYREEEFSWRLQGLSYMEIMRRGGGIASTVAATRAASMDDLVRSGLKRLDSMLSFGVTTVEGKSGYGLDSDTEIRQLEAMAELDSVHPMDVVRTFLGAHAVPVEYEGRGDAYIDHMVKEVLPEVAERNLAAFCDVFCERGVFTVEQSARLLTGAREAGLGLKIHADEIVPFGGAELAAELGTISADHLLHATREGIRAMARAGVIATLLPGTAFSLKQPYADGRSMIDSGCAVALASDLNPGSCYTESIPLIAALSVLHTGLTVEETVTALTINGAAALGRAGTVGSIDPGKKGDLLILEYPSYRFIPYHIGVSAVERVIKDGVVVYDKTLSLAGIPRGITRDPKRK
ncbi:MAG: imidazolonepropionase [Desulfobacteraceae bacterium]|nr:imidazolonepropionase [Desulfobacteraceae bacterium]